MCISYSSAERCSYVLRVCMLHGFCVVRTALHLTACISNVKWLLPFQHSYSTAGLCHATACCLTASHLQAARYQIMIMFLIAATTCIAVVGSVYLAVLNILDRQHRLCSEKILPRAAAGSGVEHWIQGQTVRVSAYKLQAKQDFKLAWAVAFSIKSRDKQARLRMPKWHQGLTVIGTASCCIFRDRQPSICPMHACMFCVHWLSCLISRLKCRTMLKVKRTLTCVLVDAGLQVCEQGGEACYRAHQSVLWAKGKAVYSVSRHWPRPPLQAEQEQPPSGLASCLVPSQAMLSCDKNAGLSSLVRLQMHVLLQQFMLEHAR